PPLTPKGGGRPSRFNIGLVIAAGMTIGTIFTLFITPAVYTFLAKDYKKAKERALAKGHGEGPLPGDPPDVTPAAGSEEGPAAPEPEAENTPASVYREGFGPNIPASDEAGDHAARHSAEVLAFSSAAQAASAEAKEKGSK